MGSTLFLLSLDLPAAPTVLDIGCGPGAFYVMQRSD